MAVAHSALQVTATAKEICSALGPICWMDQHEGAGAWLAGAASLLVGVIALLASALPIWLSSWRDARAVKRALTAALSSIEAAAENFHGLMPETERLWSIMSALQVTQGMLDVFLARTDKPHLVMRLLEMRGIVAEATNAMNTLIVTHRYPGMDAGGPNGDFAGFKSNAEAVVRKTQHIPATVKLPTKGEAR